MGEKRAPEIYSIAAHRGFADALVAGLVPRYSEETLGLARLTLLLPSSRAARTVSEAFIRQSGDTGTPGMLMPRMVTVGDLDLDEALGSLLDPLGASEIPPSVDPTRRWLELADILRDQLGDDAPSGAALMRLARETARTMDRVLIENVPPSALIADPVLDMLGSLSEHWIKSLHLFLGVQDEWLRRLDQRGEVDAATRRNLLFGRAAAKWRAEPPQSPIVAAGVTSAAPELARMLRIIADLPNGAVILPDLDLSMPAEAWNELGRAGQSDQPDGEAFGQKDVLSHPQYHLKLLLNRMGVARGEVRPWHRKGLSAAEPARSHAISSLFLPPEASKGWIELDASKRRLSDVRLLTSPTAEEEAQAIALLVREALETPEKRVAVVAADRNLARRVAQHLARWNIQADDSAGRKLSLTPAGRLFLLLADLISDRLAPATLIGALLHPLVRSEAGEMRRDWLEKARAFERSLRGPTPAPGLPALRKIAESAGVEVWWEEVEKLLSPLLIESAQVSLADALNLLAETAESLANEAVWAREDGRALASMIEDIRLNAGMVGTEIAPKDLGTALRDAMDEIAVRPPYGGHPRVAIYGLLESRMARADLVICGGLNEGTWPQSPGPDALLAPGILRSLGVPGAEFRIGLAAHDLAGAMGAPEVVLSRSLRDADGPTIPSRFLLRVEAMLGELADNHREAAVPRYLPKLDRAVELTEEYPRPAPIPTAEQRDVPIKVTSLDRLLGDPYQFYAQEILGLRPLEDLAADPFIDPRLRGTLAHDILEAWHDARRSDPKAEIVPLAEQHLRDSNCHPLLWGLWRPRLLAALERFADWIDDADDREVIAWEVSGGMDWDGVRVHGRADRIDRLADGSLAIVDYKTGGPPSASQVQHGFALQLGLLGLIARQGDFRGLTGNSTRFEYWSMARSKKDGEFGYVDMPMKVDGKRTGLAPDEFLPSHEAFLNEAISRYIKGSDPFLAKENPDYPGYSDFDQLMRLEEWLIRLADSNTDAGDPA